MNFPAVSCARFLMSIGLAGVFVATSALAAEPVSCVIDRKATLALDENAFDQDRNRGWRPLAERSECRPVAADLIRDYRNSGKRLADEHLLFWHEGQLRALMGQVDQSVALFKQSRMAPAPQIPEIGLAAWNNYADATIAFMQNDRAGLLAAREALRKLPPPLDRNGKEIPRNQAWNLDVVNGLVNCLGSSYEKSYSQECRTRTAE